MENVKVESVRVNIKLPKEVKEWYQQEAEKYGITMSGLMAYTLSKNFENEDKMKTIKEMNLMAQQMKSSNDIGLVGDMMENIQSVLSNMLNADKNLEFGGDDDEEV